MGLCACESFGCVNVSESELGLATGEGKSLLGERVGAGRIMTKQYMAGERAHLFGGVVGLGEGKRECGGVICSALPSEFPVSRR